MMAELDAAISIRRRSRKIRECADNIKNMIAIFLY